MDSNRLGIVKSLKIYDPLFSLFIRQPEDAPDSYKI